MSITNGYVALSRFKTFLDETGTDRDTQLEKYIETASRYIDSMTGRIFFSTTLTNKYLDVFSISAEKIQVQGNKIWFPCGNLTITSIVEDGTALVEEEDYWVNSSHIERSGDWTTSRRKSSTLDGIKITGSFGYSESTAPYELQQVTMEIAKIFANEGKKDILQEADIEAIYITKTIPSYVKNWLSANRIKL